MNIRSIIKSIPLLGSLAVLIKNYFKKKQHEKSAERLIPEFYQENSAERNLFLRHQFAYEFAKKHISQRMSILDYGCGDGYGSHFLAQAFPDNNIIGTDIDIKSIKYAKKKYKQTKNLHFINLYRLKKKQT